MITIKAENYKHISQDSYNKIINSLDLALVPCPCGHSGCLIRHGTYKRRVQLNDKVLTLTVVRVLCTSCGHTHALLLSSIVPYSQIPLELQAAAIRASSSGSSLSPVLQDQSFVDECNLRYVIRSFRRHWKERLTSSGLSPADIPSLISGCFRHFSRQFMQIKTTVNKLFPEPT